jgi:hypothetical protein
MTIMPRNLKKMVRSRMEKTGESYQQALRQVRQKGADQQPAPESAPAAPPMVYNIGLPPDAKLRPMPQVFYPDVVRGPENRAYSAVGALNAPPPPPPPAATGGRTVIPGGLRFTFFLFPAHQDLSWVIESFSLLRRRFIVEGSQVHVEMPASATEADALAEVNHYCAALRRHGLFVLRAQTYGEFVSAPPAVQTVRAAGPDERARSARTFRAARRELLGATADEALVQGYDYLHEARDIHITCSMRAQADTSLLVPLYKCIESVSAPLGGPDRAGKTLGLAAELRDLKRLCNERSRDTRHAPEPGQARLPVSMAELDDAMLKAAMIMRAYERHLGLQ